MKGFSHNKKKERKGSYCKQEKEKDKPKISKETHTPTHFWHANFSSLYSIFPFFIFIFTPNVRQASLWFFLVVVVVVDDSFTSHPIYVLYCYQLTHENEETIRLPNKKNYFRRILYFIFGDVEIWFDGFSSTT